MNCIRCKKELPENSLFCNFCGKRQTGAAPKPKKKVSRRRKGTGSIAGPLVGRISKPFLARTASGDFAGYYHSYEEANMALREMAETCIRPDIYNITLFQVFEAVTAERKWSKLSKGQQSTLQGAFKRFSALHSEKMRLLRARDYQFYFDGAEDQGHSYSGRQKMKQVLSKCCAWAVDNDVVTNDYSALIDIGEDDTKERTPFTDGDIKKLFAAASDSRASAIICIMISTGWRPADLAKIKRDGRVDLKNKGVILEGSKTSAGKGRYSAICAPAWPLFTRFYLAANQDDWIFPSPSGAQFDLANFRIREFYPELDRLGIMASPYDSQGKTIKGRKAIYTPYTCRHTFATLSDNAGIKKEILQQSIGHIVGSDITETYIHKAATEKAKEFSSEFQKLADKIDRIIG